MDKGLPALIHKGNPMPKQHPSSMRSFSVSEALLFSEEAAMHSRARRAGRVIVKQERADAVRKHGNAPY